MTSDQIGELAETHAKLLLTRPMALPFPRLLFRVTPLGDKYPAADWLVDAFGEDARSVAYFFVQVKGTAIAKPSARRLPLTMTDEAYRRLAQLTAPTYLIGVDVQAERAYLVATERSRQLAPASMAKTFCLSDDSVRIELYREVIDYWRVNRPKIRPSWFRDA